MKKKNPITGNFEKDLYKRLKSMKYAVEYLKCCAEEGKAVFLLGLRDIAKAHKVIK